MEDRKTKMDNTTNKIWPGIFQICFQLRDNKKAVPDDVCRICFTKTVGGQEKSEHHVKCYRRTRCDMCKMSIYELYPKAPYIRNFTAHTILCVGTWFTQVLKLFWALHKFSRSVWSLQALQEECCMFRV